MQTSQNEILNLEKKYWNAMSNNDVETAVSLTKFPCVVAGPKGAQSVTEAAYRDMMKKADGSKYRGIEIQDAQTQTLNPSASVITYKAEIDGKKLLYASTWVKEKNDWTCGFHSETPMQ